MTHETESINQESKNTPISKHIKKRQSPKRKKPFKNSYTFRKRYKQVYTYIYSGIFFYRTKIKSTNFKQYYYHTTTKKYVRVYIEIKNKKNIYSYI